MLMKRRYKRRHIFLRILSSVAACALVFAFALHSVQIEHEHPSHTASHVHQSGAEHEEAPIAVLVLGEFMHHADKKLLLLLMGALLLSGFVAALLCGRREHMCARANTYERSIIQQYDHALGHIVLPIERFAMRGLLNPKLH